MTPLNTIIEEEKKEFEKRFCSVAGFPVIVSGELKDAGYLALLEKDGGKVKDFLTSAIQRAYEEGRRDGIAEIAIKTNDGQTGYEVYFVTWCKNKEDADAMKKKFQEFTGLLTPDKTLEEVKKTGIDKRRNY